MSQTFQHVAISSFSVSETIFVIALDIESAGEFNDVNKLLVGSGKVNGAYE
jgi:hypothetical protein